MKKKLSLILLCGIMLFGLCGCGKYNKEVSDDSNLPLYNADNSLDDKQGENTIDDELKQDIYKKE